MNTANDRQVGGTHYKNGGEDHWDRQYRLFGPGYFVGCATKYVERYKLKNGKEDLEKAIHFIQKLMELEYPAPPTMPERGAPAPVWDFYKFVKPTGWVGFTFEGADADGFLFTCVYCHEKVRCNEFVNPHSLHGCPEPRSGYVNQG